MTDRAALLALAKRVEAATGPDRELDIDWMAGRLREQGCEILDMREGLEALANLYRKRNGKMRSCKHYCDDFCSQRRCYQLGCQRANDMTAAALRARAEGA